MEYGTKPGQVGWIDLTIPNASELADFYEAVVGWKRSEHDMGDYSDYVMSAGDNAAFGVCHARGSNSVFPPAWIMYINVESVAKSAAQCTEHGGELLDGPRTMGKHHFCLVKDPAGAYFGLLSESE